MGITAFSISLIEKYKTDRKTVIELGAQNLYDKDYSGQNPYASDYYLRNGFDVYKCIDLSGENFSLALDLSRKHFFPDINYDMVTDFGTSEHIGKEGKFDIESLYNCWHIKHQLLNILGIMINENPKSGNWPLHGFNYYTEEFYQNLCKVQGYNLLELGEHAAMGNSKDGWNVYCVLSKINDNEFMSLEQFKKLGIKKK